MRLSKLDYDLPEELIAQHPLEAREQARLRVVSARKTLAVVALGLAVAFCVGCTARRQPTTLDHRWDDPIARTFEHCGDLFTSTANQRVCEFSDRRERGYDVVEERVTCRQRDRDVECKLRPGAGPGPDQNWMNYQCNRISRLCEITAGDLGFTAGYASLFAGHNSGLDYNSSLPPAESRN
jgi:hypothetical protein